MLKNGKRLRGGLPDDGILRYLSFAVLPLVVIILIVVIMRANPTLEEPGNESQDAIAAAEQSVDVAQGNDAGAGFGVAQEAGGEQNSDAAREIGMEGDGEVSQESGGEQNTMEALENNAETAGAFANIDVSQYSLKQDEVIELSMLVQTYCQAKEDCDPELLAQVFGKGQLTEAEIASEREKMELVKASIKRYENISCYMIEGPEEGSYVMFPYFEIRYRETETLMPVLTWAYGKPDENGQYVMTQDVSDDVAEYIRRIGEKDEVQALIAQVQAAAQEAVAADEKLQGIYGRSEESEVSIGQADQT